MGRSWSRRYAERIWGEFFILVRRILGNLPANFSANFDGEFFGLVFPGFQATQKIHAQNAHPELSAFLFNFTFLNPKFIHGEFLLPGETKRSDPLWKFSEIPSVLPGLPWAALRGPLRNQFWKKRRPQPYWGGDNSGNALEASNALNHRAWGIPAVLSRGIPGNALRAFPGSFESFSGISSGKSQQYWGYRSIQNYYPRNFIFFLN